MPSEIRLQRLKCLLGEHRPTILRRAKKMLREDVCAEDATQDTMVAALSHLHTFRGDARLGTWLYRVSTNAVLMNLRHDKRMMERVKRAGFQTTVESVWLHGSRSDLPEKQVESRQENAKLYRAVEQLPEHYRDVVLLCDLREVPLDEVALQLGLSVGGVRTRRLRAHRMLKEMLT